MNFQPPPKQITYPAFNWAVQPAPDGTVLVIITVPGEQLIFPLSQEAAQQLGKQLAAPHIIRANGSDLPK